jgi:hypothetical protein
LEQGNKKRIKEKIGKKYQKENYPKTKHTPTTSFFKKQKYFDNLGAPAAAILRCRKAFCGAPLLPSGARYATID